GRKLHPTGPPLDHAVRLVSVRASPCCPGFRHLFAEGTAMTGGRVRKGAIRALMGLALASLSLPSAAFAQASIAGLVKDSSGAVLPGVTVEAASPALIEKVRSVVTDGSGQYRIVDLRPGTYEVTFSLSGFAPLKREGVELTGSFTATIDAELKVGSLAETVAGVREAPIGDVPTGAA